MSPTKCRHCGWKPADQVFVSGGWKYSIAAALHILKGAPRKAVTLPAGLAYELLLNSHITEHHLSHVNVRYPSIAVPEGDGFAIIDGTHRAWKRLIKRLPVRVFLLTVEERDNIRTEANAR